MPVLSPQQVASLSKTTRVLELGCGSVKRVPHSIAVDIHDRTVADVIHDLEAFPYPFPDNSFDMVIAEHVLEHLSDPVRVMEELHRITCPGGVIHVEVPYFSSHYFFTDPTHKHSFASRSFDYFDPNTVLGGYRYSTARFRVRRRGLYFETGCRFTRGLGRWFNRHLGLYESRFAFIFPASTAFFELEVVEESFASGVRPAGSAGQASLA